MIQTGNDRSAEAGMNKSVAHKLSFLTFRLQACKTPLHRFPKLIYAAALASWDFADRQHVYRSS